jgi:hypothetical protein
MKLPKQSHLIHRKMEKYQIAEQRYIRKENGEK